MKQFLLFLALLFVFVSCSDKDASSDSKDSTNSSSVDTTINITSTRADDSDNYTNSDIINKPGTITLGTERGNIYSDSLLQKPWQLLNIGEHVTIVEYCGTTTKNNWTEPVYKISFDLGDDLDTGYVSQSQIACRLDTLKSKKIVALTLDYNTSKEKFIGKISLFKQWNIIGTSSVELDILKEGDAPYSYSYYFSFKEKEEPTGLDGVIENFSIHTGYDACGYPSFDYTFLWNGQKLIAFPEAYSIAEAGQFHQYSYWIFPSDSLGKEGSVLQIIEGDQYEEVIENNQTINKDSTVIEYKWNKSFMSTGDTILKESRTYSVPADH